jgi:photosystem II stability/assembly factor-like uncharacterized protein
MSRPTAPPGSARTTAGAERRRHRQRPVHVGPRLVALAAALAAVSVAISAQAPRPVPAPGAALGAGPASRQAALAGLRWRSIGPANTGGRVTAIAGLPGNPKVFYAAGANGGVFKTTDGGTTFEALFTDQAVYSVGALEIAPSDHNVLWLGSGEGDPRNSASFGNGVYRSTDAGRTWIHLGLDDTEKIKRIAVHPRDPDTAWVCALGRTYGPNEMRGVFLTTDAGRRWEKVLYVDADTGCSDIAIDPENPRILYAGMYTFRRRPWRFDSGGGQTALHRSTDGGRTWTRLSGPDNTRGLPKSAMDRVGVAVAASRPATVYMITETKDEGVLFRSDDRGESWRVVHRSPTINFRPFYYSDIRVDPTSPERVYALSGSLYLSTDGGRTFDTIARGVHPDHQALWIDPLDPDRILDGNDGGLYVSNDGGRTFEFLDGIVLAQFYHVNYDMQVPYTVCGGLQDNGNWCGPSLAPSRDGIRRHEWSFLSFGDGFWAVPAPDRPWLVYSNTQGGPLYATDLRTGNTQSIHPYPKDIGSTGGPIFAYKYRYNWNAPIAVSPHDPKVVYYGANVVFRSGDYGQTWEVISPDLTTDDKSKQQSSGGEIAQDNTAAEFHCTILTIAESPVTPGVIWVGTDDGNVQVTRDGGRTWSNVVSNIPGLPPHSWIPAIEASRTDAGTAYVAVDRHRDDDYAPYIFKTSDYGRTWTRVSGDLPARAYVHVVREDPRVPGLLYAGTELGVFASWDGGRRWSSIRFNLPPVAVNDLHVHPRDNDLIVATHGRGIWILDDIAPLQQVDEAIAAGAWLAPVRPAYRWQLYTREAMFPNPKQFFGENPPYGALVTFHAAAASDRPARLVVRDASGAVVRELTAPVKAGMNRVAWDLRAEGPRPVPGSRPEGESGVAARFFGAGGPLVPPGTYRLALSLGDRTLEAPIEVRADPRLELPADAYAAQYRALLELRDMISKVNELVGHTERLARQVDALAEELRGASGQEGTGSPALKAAQAAAEAIRTYRDRLTRPGQPGLQYRYPTRLREDLTQLMGAIGQGTHSPTGPQMARLAELRDELGRAVRDYNGMAREVAASVNAAVKDRPRLVVTEVK